MNAGNVSVDDNGNETFTPDDATNSAKRLYLVLLAANSTIKKKAPVPVVPMVSNPDGSVTQGGVVIVNADGSRNNFTWSDGSVHQIPQRPPAPTVTIAVTPSPESKQAQAAIANAIAGWHVADILANAQITITIPASSAGDGLQTSATAGSPTTHPGSPKTLTGSIT